MAQDGWRETQDVSDVRTELRSRPTQDVEAVQPMRDSIVNAIHLLEQVGKPRRCHRIFRFLSNKNSSDDKLEVYALFDNFGEELSSISLQVSQRPRAHGQPL